MKYFIDLDKTIINLNGYPEIKGTRGTSSYSKQLKKMEEYAFRYGTPMPGMVQLVNSLFWYSEEVYLLTSKEERWRKSSKKLLERFGIDIGCISLIMRPNGDTRSYGRFKVDVMDKMVKKNEEAIIIDDDPRNELKKFLSTYKNITLLKVVQK